MMQLLVKYEGKVMCDVHGASMLVFTVDVTSIYEALMP